MLANANMGGARKPPGPIKFMHCQVMNQVTWLQKKLFLLISQKQAISRVMTYDIWALLPSHNIILLSSDVFMGFVWAVIFRRLGLDSRNWRL